MITIGAYASSGAPETREFTVKNAETFLRGTPVIFDSGEIAEDTSDPTAIVGIAAADAGSAPGYNMANQPSIVTFRENTIPVWLAGDPRTTFVSKLVNDSDTHIAPAAADIGAQYGLRKSSDGSWCVDKNKTTTSARVTIVKIDTDNNFVHWKFDPAHIYNV